MPPKKAAKAQTPAKGSKEAEAVAEVAHDDQEVTVSAKRKLSETETELEAKASRTSESHEDTVSALHDTPVAAVKEVPVEVPSVAVPVEVAPVVASPIVAPAVVPNSPVAQFTIPAAVDPTSFVAPVTIPADVQLLSSAVVVNVSADADPSIGLMICNATSDAFTGIMTATWEINPEKVGAIIGTKGAIIQEIQVRSGCKVLVDQSCPPGANRVVTLVGSAEQVKTAGNVIKLILAHGPTAIHINTQTGGQLLTSEMECAQPLVGRIIGGGGATIRELQSRSGAKIQIDQNFPDGVPRKVQITGTGQSIKIASELIQYVLEHGPNLPPLGPEQNGYMGAVGGMSGAVAAAMGSGPTIQFEVAKMHVGKIIGRGGEIVTLIQQKSGCSKVQIDQSVPEGVPCKVLITGAGPNQQYAIHLIQEIMQGGAQRIHSLPPFSGAGQGAAGMYGGGMQQNPYGMQQNMYGGAMMQNPYGAQGGYGGMPNQFGGMQQNPYGMAQQQGGYGMYGAPQAAQYGQQQQAYGQQQGGYGQQAQGQAQGVPGYGAAAHAPVAAAQPIPQKPATPWTEHKTDDGHVYWYNATTGVSQWERPVGF